MLSFEGFDNESRDFDVVLLDAKALLSIEGFLFEGPEVDLLRWRENGVSDMGAVASVSRQRRTALFDQILLAAKGPLEECEISDYAFSLSGMPVTKYLVHVDFTSMFRNSARLNSDGPEESAYRRATRRLVEEGFWIRDDNGWTWRYRISDKSQSMAKKYVVAFIAETLEKDDGTAIPVFAKGPDGRSDLESRLCLGIDFTDPGLDVSWSKYFAYRGLYLTSGCRINLPEEFALNERTVLVVKSPKGTVGDESYPKVLKAVLPAGASKYDYEVYPQGPDDPEGVMDGVRHPQLFDGEGIVSPDLARQINQSLAQQNKNASGAATSFQIRMPFAKGMVHEVDFRGFLEEAFGIGEEAEIVDAFGLKRRIGDVHMVITIDMLKCHGWLVQWLQGRQGTDPMKYYFERFEAGEHALYVSETNDMLDNGGKTDLNWQFLSTLDLTPDEFDDFVVEHMRYFSKVRAPQGEKEKEESRRFLLSDYLEVEDEDLSDGASEDGSEEEGDEVGEGLLFDYAEDGLLASERLARKGEGLAWRHALRKSRRFIGDPYIKKKLESEAGSRFVRCSIGRFPVNGRMLYLSHDLLRLLVVLGNDCKSCAGGSHSEHDELRIYKEGICFLGVDEFYAPSMSPAEMAPGGYCGILRNPHLSRSEQALLRRFDDPDGLYDSYFGHLDGVVMVPCDSEVPMVLGGADYDGDLVRVLGDETIVNAIKRGAFCEGADGLYRRRYPVADMSGPPVGYEAGHGGDAEAADIGVIGDHISYSQLESTFSGRVGRISNSAMRAGREAYGMALSAPEDVGAREALHDEDPCAKYSIATGMEIDAVKTGRRPQLDDILDWGNLNADRFERMGFLKYKERAEPKLRLNSREVFSSSIVADFTVDSDCGGKWSRVDFRRKQAWGSGHEELFEAVDYGNLSQDDPDLVGRYSSNLDRLPWLFAKEKNAVSGTRLRTSSRLFTFESEDGWERGLDDEVLDGFRRALNAYRRAMAEKREFDEERKRIEQGNEFEKLCRIVGIDPRWTAAETIDTEAYLHAVTSELTRWFGVGQGNGLAGLEELLRKVRGEKYDNWAFWEPERRREIARPYLPPHLLEGAIEGKAAERDSRFERIFIQASYEDGCMAMDYLIQSVVKFLKLEEVMEHCQKVSHDWEDVYGITLEDFIDDRMEDPLLYHQLIDIANWKLAEKRSWVEWNERVVEACRTRLREMLEPRGGELVKYLVYLRNAKEYFDKREGSPKKNANYREVELFWSLLTPEDVDAYIKADAQLKG